jgi:hypothetical protein
LVAGFACQNFSFGGKIQNDDVFACFIFISRTVRRKNLTKLLRYIVRYSATFWSIDLPRKILVLAGKFKMMMFLRVLFLSRERFAAKIKQNYYGI